MSSTRSRGRSARRAAFATLTAACVLAVAACGSSSKSTDSTGELTDPGDCTPVDVAVSSEKVALLTELAQTFNDSDDADLGDDCAFVRIQRKSSGAAAQLLTEGWPDEAANGPQPVVWSPASSAWGAIVNQRLSERGEDAIAPASQPFMRTPLVIAMPEPMAEALGYPETPVGYADILRLARDPDGWGAFGHPEWGQFRLGKTNPNFSTSALSATIAQYYAATGKTTGLSEEDLRDPDVQAFAKGVEASVVHYGDITMTFLNNWFRTDRRGTSLTYVSAVAVEEKSVIDYNDGNPDGILDAGETPRKPRIPLVAIYPEEGTLYSDNPYITLDAPWVDATEREGAARFESFIQQPANQEKVSDFGFRPGNPDVEVGGKISPAYGVDPSQPQTLLEVPEPRVLTALLDEWEQSRKRARVLLVLDVSGSMGDTGDPATDATKLDLAISAVQDAIDQFQPDDEIGLRIFSTDIGPADHPEWVDLVPVGPLSTNRETIVRSVGNLTPREGTPLYTTARDAYESVLDDFDASRINAVVLLTDGRNEDVNTDLEGLLTYLRDRTEGETAKPVRLFPISYGADADLATLRQIAEATNSQIYDASDPTTINTVFTNVVSNF
jgi:Ca-activated chloride channel homolog